ncbi:unnamed protein product [Moneuplotes crassus]|uniref:EamA domain-containing protein n=1 Tax=Euplotes crassus TaxID=5936 RepID=A0AAD1XJZ4_EUPCR|nr:unnamed protein product [Moneuplotes crassus]
MNVKDQSFDDKESQSSVKSSNFEISSDKEELLEKASKKSFTHNGSKLQDEDEYSYIKAFLCMIAATICLTLHHLSMKIIYERTPEINGFDTISFFGYFTFVFYFGYGLITGVDMNLFNYGPQVVKKMAGRLTCGVLLDIFISNGLRFIAISKGILILSLNPFFCAIAAAIFLKEKITTISIGSTIGAFIGIYLLTLNQSDEVKEDSHELLGYILTLLSAITCGFVFVFLRALNNHNLPLIISPLYLGISTCIQTLLIFIFKRDLLHFHLYDAVNFVILCCVGITAVGVLITMNAANKYSQASKMAPITYLENVFTVLADILIFHYHFIRTDVFGMILIVVCLCIPMFFDKKQNK